MRSPVPIALALCVMRCSSPQLGVAHSAIIGGAFDVGDPAVVAFSWVVPNTPALTVLLCTGTLIGPRTVLTAGHCINGADTSTTHFDYRVLLTSVARGSGAGSAVDCQLPLCRQETVVQQVRHPAYSASAVSVSNDVGVLQIDPPVFDVPSLALNADPLANRVGQPIRHVGFGIGIAMDGSSFGNKEQATYPINRVTSTLVESHGPASNTCSGDSGGPGLLVPAAGRVERVAGIVSFGDTGCETSGWDTRVDAQLSFIQSTMQSWEPTASCALDGRCVPGCADPDCASDGRSCTADAQCESGTCATDPQHLLGYCTHSCANGCASADTCSVDGLCRHTLRPSVPVGASCTADDFCEGFGVCAALPGEPSSCHIACGFTPSGAPLCPGDPLVACHASLTGERWCDPGRNVTERPRAVVPPVGCAAAPAEPVLALLVAVAYWSCRRRFDTNRRSVPR